MELKDLASIAIVFVIAGIILGIGSEILFKVGEKTDTLSVTNESEAFVNNTCETLDNFPIVSITQISNGTIVPSDQYELCGGYNDEMRWIANASYNPTLTWNVSYTHRNTASYWATRNTTDGTGELAGWMGTLGLVVAAGIVMTIIFKSFGAGKI